MPGRTEKHLIFIRKKWMKIIHDCRGANAANNHVLVTPIVNNKIIQNQFTKQKLIKITSTEINKQENKKPNLYKTLNKNVEKNSIDKD